MILWVLIAAAAITMLWPATPKKRTEYVPDAAKPDDSEVAYLEAVAALQQVRSRLARTDCLAEEQIESINVLALALTEGSNQ